MHHILGIHATLQLDFNLHLFCGKVCYRSCFDFAIFCSPNNRFCQSLGIGAKGQLRYDNPLWILGVQLGSGNNLAQAVLIIRHIDEAPRGTVGIQVEFLSLETGDFCLNHLLQVVTQNIGGHSHRNSLRSNHQHHRQLGRKYHRLLVAAIVGGHKLGNGRIVEHPLGQGFQATLDVSGSGGSISRVQVSEISLLVYEQFLVSQHHQGRTNGSVSVGMVLHALTHHVGHLVVASVVHGKHGVQNSPLYRL